MNNMTKKFDSRLRTLLIYSGEKRETLACAVGVKLPVVNRWLSGASVPDAYQFRDVARFFSVSYEWLLDGKEDSPSVKELADMLGLSADTVDELLTLAALESGTVMNALDDAIFSIVSAITAAQEDA